MKGRIVEILESNENVLTMTDIQFFYSKLIHPLPTPNLEIEIAINELVRDNIIEKNLCGGVYYNLVSEKCKANISLKRKKSDGRL